MRNQWILAAALATVAAGGGAVPMPARTIAQGGFCKQEKPGHEVARTAGEWEKLWRAYSGTPRDREIAPPPVDWSKEMVLAAFMGSRTTGGYRVQIQGAEEVAGKLVVTVTERKPGPGDIVAQAFTTPYHVVAVKKSALPVQWKVTDEKKPGEGKP